MLFTSFRMLQLSSYACDPRNVCLRSRIQKAFNSVLIHSVELLIESSWIQPVRRISEGRRSDRDTGVTREKYSLVGLRSVVGERESRAEGGEKRLAKRSRIAPPVAEAQM